MMIRVAFFLLCLTTAVGQTAVESMTADGPPYPRVIHAELPLYPPAAWSAHLGGMVEIDVTVEKGTVVDARVRRGMVATQGTEKGAVKEEQQSKLLPYLSLPSVANVKTWQFDPERGGRTTFSVMYVYKIEGEQTPLPENPKIELDLPRVVKVTAKPFKPSCSDCVSEKLQSGTDRTGGPLLIP